VTELLGHGDQIFPGHSGVLATLGGLRGIPKSGTVGRPAHVLAGKPRREQDFLVHDVLPVRVIVGASRAFVANALARAIRGGARRAATVRATEGFHIQEIKRHRRSAADHRLEELRVARVAGRAGFQRMVDALEGHGGGARRRRR